MGDYNPRREPFVFLDSPSIGRVDSLNVFYRLSHLNADLTRFFKFEFFLTGGGSMKRDSSDMHRTEAMDAMSARDRKYLPRISNIRQIDGEGRVLSKSEAVGVFGAFSSRYKRIKVVFDRPYDPCTIYPGTKCQNGTTSPPA